MKQPSLDAVEAEMSRMLHLLPEVVCPGRINDPDKPDRRYGNHRSETVHGGGTDWVSFESHPEKD